MSVYGKSFGLSTPAEYLDKLEWEFERMMKAGPATGRELSYHAMNLAVTGWHMTDWTYPHLPADQKQRFKNSFYFQKWIAAQHRVLAACRDVATASKHMTVRDSPDPSIETVDVGYVDVAYVEDGYVDVAWHIAIDGELYGLREFGETVISFWQNYLESLGLLPV